MFRENDTLFNRLNVASDILLLYLAMVLSFLIRFYLFGTEAPDYLPLSYYMLFLTALLPMYYLIFSYFDLVTVWRVDSFSRERGKILRAGVVAAAIVVFLLFALKFNITSRWVMVQYFFISTVLLVGKHYWVRLFIRGQRRRGRHKKKVIVLGSGQTARDCLMAIQARQEYGYDYVGYVANYAQLEGEYLGDFGSLYEILNEQKPEEVICALEVTEYGFFEQVMADCEKTGTKTAIVPFCVRYISTRPYIDQMDTVPLIRSRRIPLDNYFNAFIKRVFDIVLSFLALVLLSPVLALTAVLVKVTSPGPVIFKQERVGKNKERFVMYKFRSMVVNDQSDTAWSTDNDVRKTTFGAFIRKFSIDELPQLFNVLKGDMSIVGPRPELPHFVEDFQKHIPLYMVKHQVKPGITGLAQIKGFRGDTSITKRIEWDIYYIENWSFSLDMSILVKTVFKALKNNENLTNEPEKQQE